MKIVNADAYVIQPKDRTREGILEHLEVVARTCYKSEDKITPGSAEKMVRSLIRSGHLAMIEHTSLIIEADKKTYDHFYMANYEFNTEHRCYQRSYLRFTFVNGRRLISGNMRAWREIVQFMGGDVYSKSLYKIMTGPEYSIFFEDITMCFRTVMDYSVGWIDPDSLDGIEAEIHRDVTIKFICDRGVSHEIVRHRDSSFAQESTRYCNYANGKFGSEITVINPLFFQEGTPEYVAWYFCCQHDEEVYKSLIEMGRTPQECRTVLPNSLKTEVVMTTNIHEWIHFFNLRAKGTTGAPHPQMKEVACIALSSMELLEPEFFSVEIKEE